MSLEIKTIERDWFLPQERGYKAVSFYLSEKPESRILLTEDSDYPKMFNFHIEEGQNLVDPELDYLVGQVIDYLPAGWNLGTCGESDEQKIRLYRKFYGILDDTNCLRTLTDKHTHHPVYLKIMKKKI